MTPETVLNSLSRTAPRLLVIVFAVLVLLFVFTGFLTRAYHREERERAEHQFQVAQFLAEQTFYDAAIDHYAAALLLSRDNIPYKQALALALAETGRTEEAEAYLMEVGRIEPSNGIVNLTLARISAERGDVELATEYYQRAVYGFWESDPVGHRVRVHFELIEWLQKQGEDVLVKAELLRLLDEVPEDEDARRRVGRMFLQVNSPEEARDIFSDLLRRDSRDCASQAGLGDAEFALAEYSAARSSFTSAIRCNPEDLQSRLQLQLATEILSLDPMRRGLGIRDRVVRSRELVDRALLRLDQCARIVPQDISEQLRADTEAARTIVERQSQNLQEETVEANIALAERLHRAGPALCGVGGIPDQALDLVLRGLAE